MTTLKKMLAYPGPGAGFSLHNHSKLSDGSATPEEMCRAAKNAGLKVFGLSDHYVLHPDASAMPVEWSIDLNKLDAYCAGLEKLKREMNDENFTILTGLEVDFFFENCNDVLKELAKYPLDYLIGSVHYSGTFPIDHSIGYWENLTPDEMHSICLDYWEKLQGAAACGGFDFLGHPDLPKKFAQLPDPDRYFPEAMKVLDAAAASGTAIELNTSGWFKPVAEQYPSKAILREACRRKIPVAVNADAHCPEHVARAFPEAYDLLRRAGYSF